MIINIYNIYLNAFGNFSINTNSEFLSVSSKLLRKNVPEYSMFLSISFFP